MICLWYGEVSFMVCLLWFYSVYDMILLYYDALFTLYCHTLSHFYPLLMYFWCTFVILLSHFSSLFLPFLPLFPSSLSPPLSSPSLTHPLPLAYLSWSYLTALATMIWFFPLFDMGLSGSEAAIFATLSPLLFAIPGVRRISVKLSGLFHLLSLVGIAAYMWPKPSDRLMLGGVALAVNMMVVTGGWWETDHKRNRTMSTNGR